MLTGIFHSCWSSGQILGIAFTQRCSVVPLPCHFGYHFSAECVSWLANFDCLCPMCVVQNVQKLFMSSLCFHICDVA